MSDKPILSLISIVFLMLLASDVYGKIGVKQGDWAKYDAYFFQDMLSFEAGYVNYTTDIDFLAHVEVLSISGSDVTFRHTMLRLNGSLLMQETLTADPDKPYSGPPLYNVHLFFIPAGLSVGDRIPQPMLMENFSGGQIFVPYLQWVNETVNRNYSGVVRQANHIKWKWTSSGSSGSNGKWDQTIEKDCYYDKETGVMLEFNQNSSKRYYAGYTVTSRYLETHRYAIKESNILATQISPPWTLYVTVGGVSSVAGVILVRTLMKRRSSNAHKIKARR